MRWERVNRRDRRACVLADRHYSRTVIGAPQVGGNAALVVLVTPCGDALWITSFDKWAKHAWPDTWNCTLFRNESPALSSELITQAVSVTRYLWGTPPPNGIITFVDSGKTRTKRDPGRCYVRAGWARLPETTKGGLIVLRQLPDAMPAPHAPLGALPLEAA